MADDDLMDAYYNEEIPIKHHQLSRLIVYDELGKVMFRFDSEMTLEVAGHTLRVYMARVN